MGIGEKQEPKKEDMKRIIEFTPAYDKRNKNPKNNYGIGGVNIRFVLKGSKGAVQFLLLTGWHLPHVEKEFEKKGLKAGAEYRVSRPMPADLGYHSPKPMYEGQEKFKKCDYIKNGCYYDGSGLNAERVFKILVSKGEEALWALLEDYYYSIFGGKL